jgi:hypothetical protein
MRWQHKLVRLSVVLFVGLVDSLVFPVTRVPELFPNRVPPTVLSLHVHVLIVVGQVSLAVFFSLHPINMHLTFSFVHSYPTALLPFLTASTIDRVAATSHFVLTSSPVFPLGSSEFLCLPWSRTDDMLI